MGNLLQRMTGQGMMTPQMQQMQMQQQQMPQLGQVPMGFAQAIMSAVGQRPIARYDMFGQGRF